MLRAIQTVTTKLSDAGHTVLPWEPYEHRSAIDLFMSIIGADGGTVSLPCSSEEVADSPGPTQHPPRLRRTRNPKHSRPHTPNAHKTKHQRGLGPAAQEMELPMRIPLQDPGIREEDGQGTRRYYRPCGAARCDPA